MDLAEILLDPDKGFCLLVICVGDPSDDVAPKMRTRQDGREFNPLLRTRERYPREPRAIAQIMTETIEENIQIFMHQLLIDPFPDLQAAVERRVDGRGNDRQDGHGDQQFDQGHSRAILLFSHNGHKYYAGSWPCARLPARTFRSRSYKVNHPRSKGNKPDTI